VHHIPTVRFLALSLNLAVKSLMMTILSFPFSRKTRNWRLNMHWRVANSLNSMSLKHWKFSSQRYEWDCVELFTTSPLWGLSPRGPSSENILNIWFQLSTINFRVFNYMMNASLLLIPMEENLWIRRSLFAKFVLRFNCGGCYGIKEGKAYIHWSQRIHSHENYCNCRI